MAPGLSLLTLAALSAPAVGAPARDGPRDRPEAFEGPVLEGPLVPDREPYFHAGLAVEPFTSDAASFDFLFGATFMLRVGPWGPHVALLSDPRPGGYEDSRFLVAGGVRGYFPILGVETSYGVSIEAEARLSDHFWLAEATPVELGAVVFSKNSWDLQLFVGVRRVFGGGLINHFLIDPNGVDNEDARDRFAEQRFVDPWRGFVRLVFGRRLD